MDLATDLYPPGPKSRDTYSREIEAATKDFHDRLLRYTFSDPATRGIFHAEQLSEDHALLGNQLTWTFPWGKVCSLHHPRDLITSIIITYGDRWAEAVREQSQRPK